MTVNKSARWGEFRPTSAISSSAGTLTVSLATVRSFSTTLTENVTLAVTNVLGISGIDTVIHFYLKVTQNGTGGWVITWPGSVQFLSDEPDQATAPAEVAIYEFLTFDQGTTWIVSRRDYGAGGAVDAEDVQDIVGVMATDSTSINFTYNDGAATLSAAVTLDGSTLSSGPSGLSVSTSGISPTELAANAVTEAKLDINNSPTADYLLAYDVSGRMKWVTPSSSYTDENAQDAVAAALGDTNSIDFTYNDASNTIRFDLRLDGGTLQIGGSGVSVAASGIGNTQLAPDSVGETKLDALNTPTGDGSMLGWDTTSGRFEWFAPFTDEHFQDAVGTILVDTNSIDLTYTDATPSITASLRLDGSTLTVGAGGTKVTDAGIDTAQLTDAAVTVPKLAIANSPTDQYLLGWDAVDGMTWFAPAGGGGGLTEEQVQDSIAGILTGTNTIDWTYNDTTPTISADVRLDGSTLSSSGSGLKVGTIGSSQLGANSVVEAALDAISSPTAGYYLKYDASGRLDWSAPVFSPVFDPVLTVEGEAGSYDADTPRIELQADSSTGKLAFTGLSFLFLDDTDTILAELNSSGVLTAEGGNFNTNLNVYGTLLLPDDSVLANFLDTMDTPAPDELLAFDVSGQMKWVPPPSGLTITGNITAQFRHTSTIPAATVSGIVRMTYDGEITKATAAGGPSGSIVVDVEKCAYASFPGSFASIVASAPVTISSGTKSEDSTLPGWTKTFVAGDLFRFTVTSATTMQDVMIHLETLRD